jgi:CubicO group peptidase (beta-lactamase class C family)
LPALADSAANYFPAATWRTAKPEDVGFDASKISTLVNDISRGTYGAIDGVLVVRYGYLVVEKYNNWQPNTAHTMQSVSKSITSLLYGIASQQRAELALDRPVVDVFTNYSDIANNDARKRALTIRHMLSMRTSMDFYEQP